MEQKTDGEQCMAFPSFQTMGKMTDACGNAADECGSTADACVNAAGACVNAADACVPEKIKHVVLAFDSFKGSLTQTDAFEAAQQGVKEVCPHCSVSKLLVADGGEGFTLSYVQGLNYRRMECQVCNPLGKTVSAWYALLPNGTAVMELAAASGLTLLMAEERNVMKASTWGTGMVMKDAVLHGARRIVLGIGGSATNDAAMGLLAAVGFQFLDADGRVVEPCGEALQQVHTIVPSSFFNTVELQVACDVNNPFYGQMGAAHVYAPQKGATPTQVQELDHGLQHFAQVVQRCVNKDVQRMPGAGAAGGVGGALWALAGAQLCSGIDLILEAHHLSQLSSEADYVFTGEGCVDAQSSMGKVLGGVVRMSGTTPVVAFCGCCKTMKMNDAGDDDSSLSEVPCTSFAPDGVLPCASDASNACGMDHISEVVVINPPGTPLAQAMNTHFAKEQLRKAVRDFLKRKLKE